VPTEPGSTEFKIIKGEADESVDVLEDG